MYCHSKSAFLQVTLILHWSKLILVVNNLTQILPTFLTFITLLILRKISICGKYFLFGVSLCKLSIYTLMSD